MIQSVNGSFTSDGTAFYFNDFGKYLNKAFETTDKTGYGSLTYGTIYGYAVDAYKKANTELEKRLYKAIAEYCLALSKEKNAYYIKNVHLAEIYKAMAMADGVEDAWELVVKKMGGYTSKYPETYAELMVRLNAVQDDTDKTPVDKKVEKENIAKEVAEEKFDEIVAENTPTIQEQTTSTAGSSWWMILAAVGVGFALLFGGDNKKKNR